MKEVGVLIILTLTFLDISAQNFHIDRSTYTTILSPWIKIIKQKLKKLLELFFSFHEEIEILYQSLSVRKLFYSGLIEKEENMVAKGEYVVSRKFTNTIGNNKLPLGLSEIFSNSKSTIPIRCFLVVLNKYTMKPVQYILLTSIK